MSVLATPEALTVLAGFATLVLLWTVYRFIHDTGAHSGGRHDPDPEPYPEDAADYTMPGMFLGAPITEEIAAQVIPIKPVHGTPPWVLPQRYEELVHLPEPGDDQRDYAEEAYWRSYCDACGGAPCTWDGVPDGFHADEPGAAPIVADITRTGHGATLTGHDTDDRAGDLIQRYEELERFRRQLESLPLHSGDPAGEVFELMGGTS